MAEAVGERDVVWSGEGLGAELARGAAPRALAVQLSAELMSGALDIATFVQNMSEALTHKDAECRARGMTFFTEVLRALPTDHLSEPQVQFIATFYTDRLKDNHRVVPPVIEGFQAIIEMKNFTTRSVGEFFTILFREVPCQSQLRPDRYNIYLIIDRIVETRLEYMKTLGPDFVFGVISAIDGERDPRNLMFLFSFLPKFMRSIPLGHLVEEMFEVISCYYPIDFNASPNDPDAVTREDLADALAPCLCAVPEFGESSLLLLIEKLDSSLRLAKIDSLKLLVETCRTFDVSTYTPFLKTLWASIQREIMTKSDEELGLAAHEALYALVHKLSETQNTDQTFENFVKGVLISMQTALADATLVVTFDQISKALLTCANASKWSCIIIVKAMIPSTVAYYALKMGDKLQVASLGYLVKLFEVAKHWHVLENMEPQLNEIPELCLSAVSLPQKEHQIAGFKTVIGTIDILKQEYIVPFVEILTYNIHHVQDDDLLAASIQCIHAIALKYPEQVMDIVVNGKFKLKAITEEKELLPKRLTALSNLASIDYFTETIIKTMLTIISTDDAQTVVNVLNTSISNNSLFTEHKVSEIEKDHNFVDSILTWLVKEVSNSASPESLTYGYSLISSMMARLTSEKQTQLLEKHTDAILAKCTHDESYLLILEALYNSLRQEVFNEKFRTIRDLCLQSALHGEFPFLRMKCSALVAHILNKVESKSEFDLMHDTVKSAVATCEERHADLGPRVIGLCGWIAKSLLLRGANAFEEWTEKIVSAISTDNSCFAASEAIKLIMTDDEAALHAACHCRTSLFYKQRMFQHFVVKAGQCPSGSNDTKEAYLLSWAYVLAHIPKTILIGHVEQISPIIIASLDLDNKTLLMEMLEVMLLVVQAKHQRVVAGIQSILPRLIKLTTYAKSMHVRINSLRCLEAFAKDYPPVLLLPYKRDVVADLIPSLGDMKRLVRNAATKTRSRWIMVGAPGGDE